MDVDVFLRAPLIIQVHALSALSALAIGLVQILGPKGTLPHRTLGIAFVTLMAVVAGTAVFIRNINDGGFSFIHIFVPVTAVGLFGLVRNVRSNGTEHGRAARNLFFFALMIPGFFAFMPGRLMWNIFAG